MQRIVAAMNTQPTNDTLVDALAAARIARFEGGALKGATIRVLEVLRDARTTWCGFNEAQLRHDIDGMLLSAGVSVARNEVSTPCK